MTSTRILATSAWVSHLWSAGITYQGAQGVEVADNYVRGNHIPGIKAKTGDRQRTSSVRIHHNFLPNDTLKGCKLAGVVCRANGR